MKKLFVLLGPPGSGKTTIAREMTKHGLEVIDTGELLRRNRDRMTRSGRPVGAYLREGSLVPDASVTDIVREAIDGADSARVLLDGFPRDPGQVEQFGRLMEEGGGYDLAMVVILNVYRALAVKRLTGRRICPKDGSIYNVYFNPPERDEVCDRCGTPLMRREDDSLDTVKRRMDAYEQDTIPVIEHFKEHYPRVTYEMSSEKPLNQVVGAILSAVPHRETAAV